MADDMDGLQEVDIAVEDIVDSEGLKVVADLYQFYVEALDVAVDWIFQLRNELTLDETEGQQLTHEDIRVIISGHVESQNMDDIINRLEALSEVQGDINDEDEVT